MVREPMTIEGLLVCGCGKKCPASTPQLCYSSLRALEGGRRTIPQTLHGQGATERRSNQDCATRVRGAVGGGRRASRLQRL